jgi:transcriptional regulator NrdR family protein
MVKLPDPERCPMCQKRGELIDSRMVSRRGRGVMKNGAGLCYRRRRHKCKTCKVRWNSYQTTLNPNKIKSRPTTQPVV